MNEINPMVGAVAASSVNNEPDAMHESSGTSHMGNSMSASNNRVTSHRRSSSSRRAANRDADHVRQQRLLLLYHAAKCPNEDGRCTVTRHCADMKRLWKHMEACKDKTCRVPHCFSSRVILNHYRNCKNASCPYCGPVRETVKKSKQARTKSSSRGDAVVRSAAPVASSEDIGMPSTSLSQQLQQLSLMSSSGPMVSLPGSSLLPPNSSVTPSSFQQPVSHPTIQFASHVPVFQPSI